MKSFFARFLLLSLLTLSLWTGFLSPQAAFANLNDDHLDGNIFVLYAGNGSLVPSKLSVQEARARKIPTILVYYLDDSQECKEFSVIVSRLQEFYGRAASIVPVNVDSIPTKATYQPTEAGYYYQGYVPQTVLLNNEGEEIFNAKGNVKYEVIDDELRKLFDLLPRRESTELKRRSFNEFNTELVK